MNTTTETTPDQFDDQYANRNHTTGTNGPTTAIVGGMHDTEPLGADAIQFVHSAPDRDRFVVRSEPNGHGVEVQPCRG